MLWRYLYLFEYSPIIVRIFFFGVVVVGIPSLFVDIKKGTFLDYFQQEHVDDDCCSGLDGFEKTIVSNLFEGRCDVPMVLITNSNVVDDKNYSNVEVISKRGIVVERVLHPSDCCSCINAQGLLIDLPEVGNGDRDSIICLCEIMHEAVKTSTPLIIIDRPNLLGKNVEGPFISYTHRYNVVTLPMKHGMTVGEFAYYYNMQWLSGKAKIEVVPMRNYCRQQQKVLCVIQNLCFFLSHIAPLYVRCDDTFPHGCLMLPASTLFMEKHWYQLQVTLREYGINAIFCTYTDEKTHELYKGVKYCLADATKEVNSFDLLVTILTFFRSVEMPITFLNSFDHLFGSPVVRHYLQGKMSKKKFASFVNKELEKFYYDVFGLFIYSPLPSLFLIS